MRKSSSAHSEHKKRQIIEMVRDETEDKLREMARADAEITGMLFPRGHIAQRAQLYTDPLTKVGKLEAVPKESVFREEVHFFVNIIFLSVQIII